MNPMILSAFFKPHDADLIASVFLFGVAALFLLTGRAHLLPYSVDRKTNPRAFYVVVLVIVVMATISAFQTTHTTATA